MSVVTVVWSMIAAACLTLAAVHLPVWWRDREESTSLAFSIAAICTAVIACCELFALQARTPQAYAAAVRAAHIPVTVLLISLVAFILFYLQAGRLRAGGDRARAACALDALQLPVRRHAELPRDQSMQSIEFLGEQVLIPVGEANPWMLLSHVGILLVLVFLVDATLTVWRRGQRGIALWVGVSVTLVRRWRPDARRFCVYWFGWQSPGLVSPFFLGVVAVMGYAMFRDLVNAKRLVAELRESEQQVASAAAAAQPRHLRARPSARRDRGERQMARAVRLLADGAARLTRPCSRGCIPTTGRVRERIHVRDREGRRIPR